MNRLDLEVVFLTVSQIADTPFVCANFNPLASWKVDIEDCADTYGEKRLPLLFNGVQRSAVGAR